MLHGLHAAITGHRGVLGSLLTQRLREHDIQVSVFTGDVADTADITQWIRRTQADVMFHLAAIVPLKKVESDPFAAMRVNAIALASIQEAIVRFSPESWLFFASTSHVYSATTHLRGGYRRLTETSPTEPISLYGATKLAGERIIIPLARNSGTQLCVGRIFSYFHEQQSSSFLIPGLISRIENAHEESVIEVRDADSVRDFLHADMVIDAILFLCARRATMTVNIGSGCPMSVGCIANRLRELSSKNITLQYLPSMNPSKLVADIRTLRSIISSRGAK
jgi:nucleoside-diphosphate-sugar epimerase